MGHVQVVVVPVAGNILRLIEDEGEAAGRAVCDEFRRGGQRLFSHEMDGSGADQGDFPMLGEESQHRLHGVVHEVVVIVEDHDQVA